MFFLSFAWSVLARLHPCGDRKSANRVTKYKPFRGKLVNCDAPMPVEPIDQFELANQIAVHVYELDENKRVVPLRTRSFDAAPQRVVDLLLIERGDARHYCLITDLQKLLQHASAGESTFVELPTEIASKKACVNNTCNAIKSFKWCVLAAKYPVSRV